MGEEATGPSMAPARDSDLIVEIDASGTARRFGLGARLLGLPDVPGGKAWELLAYVYSDDLARVCALAASAQSEPGVSAHDRLRFRRSDGVWIEIDLEIRALPEGALSLHLKRWTSAAPPDGRHLLDAAPTPLGLIDHSGTFVAANRALCLLLGYEEVELLGRTPSSLVHSDDASASAKMGQLLESGALSVEAELQWIRSDGESVRVVERRGRAREASGFGLLIHLAPVTARSGHDALDETRTATLGSAVLEAAGAIVMAIDGDGVIVLANRAATEASGFAGELVGRRLADVFPSPVGGFSVADLAGRALAGQATDETETSFAASDGTVHMLSWTLGRADRGSGHPLLVLTGLDVTERHATLADLAHRAFHDPLTHLPNRNLLRERITHALTRLDRTAAELAVLFVDLNHFKRVNDRLGHNVGDRVLAILAARLETAVRPSDTIARFGGDEFVALCEDITDAQTALEIADRLVQAVEMPVQIDGEEVRISASVGITFARHSGTDPDALLREADAAMYEAKRRGGVDVSRREAPTSSASPDDVTPPTEEEIRDSVARGGVVVFFQPEVSLSHGHVTGVEALVRLRHPRLGLLMPAAFLPLAEHTEVIVAIGDRVLEEVCRQAVRWQRLGLDVNVAVNVSARELSEAGLANRVDRTLRDAGAPASSLVLEVPERELLDVSDETASELKAVKALGVKVAVDDAGTAFTTAGLVRELPIDQVKIGGAFVRELANGSGTAPVVASILRLARTLEVQTVAEGVETEWQVAALRSLGCDAAQGYLFASPQPADAIAQLLGPDLRLRTTPIGPPSI